MFSFTPRRSDFKLSATLSLSGPWEALLCAYGDTLVQTAMGLILILIKSFMSSNKGSDFDFLAMLSSSVPREVLLLVF